MNYNWDWSIFWQASPSGGGTYMDNLLTGLAWTIAAGLLAGIIALIVGTLIGTAVTLPNKWIRRVATAYIELFRNIPLLVQMFLWYFVLPEVLPIEAANWIKSLKYSSVYTAILSLGFYTASRVAVQVQAGLNTLGRGQKMAGLALGLTLWQVYRYVLLPTVFRIIVPPLTSEFMGVIKNSAVALTIGFMELTARARAMQEYSFQTFEAFTVATLMYICISLIVVQLMNIIEKKVSIPGFVSSVNTNSAGH